MDQTVVVGLLALAGTLVGSLGGILTANKLTTYRIAELEKKVDKHNNHVERMVVLERDVKTLWNRSDENRKEIAELRRA